MLKNAVSKAPLQTYRFGSTSYRHVIHIHTEAGGTLAQSDAVASLTIGTYHRSSIRVFSETDKPLSTVPGAESTCGAHQMTGSVLCQPPPNPIGLKLSGASIYCDTEASLTFKIETSLLLTS